MERSELRIVRVFQGDDLIWGVLDGEDVLGLAEAPCCGRLQTTSTVGKLSELELAAPAAPSKIVCIGRNYAAHADEHGVDVPSEPLLFFKPPSSVIGPGQAIVLPALSERVEHEAELAVVIGRRCRQVSPDEAWSHVLGVTCGNDVTARDLQRRDAQWTRGKGFDTFCPLGPWVVAGAAESRFADVEVSCRVNGDPRQSGRTRDMVFTPAQLIAYISEVMTLEVGDVIMTGTPSGVSPLAPGDEVEVEVEVVGVLSNPVR